MNLGNLLENALEFYHDYPLIVIGLGVLTLIWAYLRPKQLLKGGLFLCFVIAMLYVLSLIDKGTGSSLSVKEKMMHKTERALAD